MHGDDFVWSGRRDSNPRASPWQGHETSLTSPPSSPLSPGQSPQSAELFPVSREPFNALNNGRFRRAHRRARRSVGHSPSDRSPTTRASGTHRTPAMAPLAKALGAFSRVPSRCSALATFGARIRCGSRISSQPRIGRSSACRTVTRVAARSREGAAP